MTTTITPNTKIRGPRRAFPEGREHEVAERLGYPMRSLGRMRREIGPTGNEDIALIAQVIDFAAREQREAHQEHRPSRFNMREWYLGRRHRSLTRNEEPSCGTSMCFAGTAVYLRLRPNETLLSGGLIALPGGNSEHVEERAPKELGLTRTQAGTLFYMVGATIDDLRLVAGYMTGRDMFQVGL